VLGVGRDRSIRGQADCSAIRRAAFSQFIVPTRTKSRFTDHESSLRTVVRERTFELFTQGGIAFAGNHAERLMEAALFSK
jgi:hypothetical protein